MEAMLTLNNGRKVYTKDIKCPICGEKMKLCDYKENPLKSSSLYRTDLPQPFRGLQTRERNEYESIFECPNECCELHIKHFLDELIM